MLPILIYKKRQPHFNQIQETRKKSEKIYTFCMKKWTKS